MRRPIGFTLIEVLVVIAILGILVSISSLVWGSVAARSRDNTRKTDLARLKNTLEQYSTDHRSYPTYDSVNGRIYAASWQLANSTDTTCTHDTRINDRLINISPKVSYLSKIPRDPQRDLAFDGTCSRHQDQHSLYLYISSPGDSTGHGPSATSSSTGFALLATLEQAADHTLDTENPIKSSVGKFAYYCAANPLGGCQLGEYHFDANYVIYGGSSR